MISSGRSVVTVSYMIRYLVDPASSHMLVPKIKPCMSKYKQVYTVKLRMAHYISYNLFDSLFTTWITVVILELIHAKSPTSGRAVFIRLKTDAGNR
jgi:hypothetical protein